MRLTRLDLERYGPFTGQRLVFRPDAALHLVYGRNEAGKSSALAAITDLFYGFEMRSRANFVHRNEDLRIGGEILTREGASLKFRRRKGTRNTLIDANEAALDETLLDLPLGGVSREVFVSAFGLSQAGLRRGAEDMLAAGGEIGESLFAAASGARGMVGARDDLHRRADELFAPRRAARRAFYEAEARYTEARRDLRERSLRAETLKNLGDTIAGHEARLSAIAARLRDLAAGRSRLDRIRRVGHLIARIDGLAGEIAALGPLPGHVADLPARIEAGLARAASCQAAVTRFETEAGAAGTALAAIAVDETLLGSAAAIAALGDERAALAKAQADLPRRLTEARAVEDELTDHARRLGLADRAALAASQPDDLTIARARDLIERKRRLDLEAEGAAKALASATQSLAALEQRQAGAPVAIEIEPLRQRLTALRPALAEAVTLDERQADIAQRSLALADRLARLRPAVDTRLIEAGALPEDDAIAAHEAALAGLVAARAHAGKEIVRLEAQVAGAQRDLGASLSATEELDADVLAAFRARRDASFEAVLAAPETGRIDRYREEVAKADRLADARLAHADAVARRETARASLVAAETALARANAVLAEVDDQTARLDGAWRDLFAPLSVEPGNPGEMRRWLAAVRQLRDERAALDRLEAGNGAALARLRAERPALDALALEAGLSDPATRSIGTLGREIEQRLAGLEAGGKQARSSAASLEATREQQAQAARAEQAARAAQAAFAPEWQRILVRAGLSADAAAAEVTKALDLRRDAQTLLSRLADLDHRIASIRDDGAAFAAKVTDLKARIAPDADPEPAVAVAGLIERLARQTEADTRRRAAIEQLERQEAGLAGARAAGAQANAGLEALAREAGCPVEQLAAIACDLRNAIDLERQLNAARRDLAGQGDGLGEPALRAEREGLDPEGAAALVQEIETEAQNLNAEDKALSLELGERKREFAALENASGAAQAAQRLQDARTDLERIARDYLTLKAAALLIGAGIERAVRARQDPLVEQAGALFARITGEAFSGIAVSYDEGDELRLHARRRDGALVPVTGLSEGSCDQLYLALRLASLDAVASRRSAPPFIGDDLVVTFDEARVAATLDTLAASGPSFQKILFTHHLHVVEIARERLGERLDLVEFTKA